MRTTLVLGGLPDWLAWFSCGFCEEVDEGGGVVNVLVSEIDSDVVSEVVCDSAVDVDEMAASVEDEPDITDPGGAPICPTISFPGSSNRS